MRRMILLNIVVATVCASARADCPLDHLVIGCNCDGAPGTEDDRRLFVDCTQKYHHSGDAEYERWYYPLHESVFPSYPYRIGEPGFDAFQNTDRGEEHTYDPNRTLAGEPNLDYSVTVECIARSPGLQAVHKEYPQFTMGDIGDTFNHSYIHSLHQDSHIHMSYQATDGGNLHWITFRVHDGRVDNDRYESSRPFTIVFNTEPPAGDLAVDGRVDGADFREFSRYWLSLESSRRNDYCERADTDRDGFVDFFDFARLAANWRAPAR